jgi:exodeoxyribonuclease-5
MAVGQSPAIRFFRRQEVHDLIALARTITDSRDTLALGALMRGPLVGLTEAELLDIADALPIDPTRPADPPHLTLWTDLDHVGHDLARRVLEILRIGRIASHALVGGLHHQYVRS